MQRPASLSKVYLSPFPARRVRTPPLSPAAPSLPQRGSSSFPLTFRAHDPHIAGPLSHSHGRLRTARGRRLDDTDVFVRRENRRIPLSQDCRRASRPSRRHHLASPRLLALPAARGRRSPPHEPRPEAPSQLVRVRRLDCAFALHSFVDPRLRQPLLLLFDVSHSCPRDLAVPLPRRVRLGALAVPSEASTRVVLDWNPFIKLPRIATQLYAAHDYVRLFTALLSLDASRRRPQNGNDGLPVRRMLNVAASFLVSSAVAFRNRRTGSFHSVWPPRRLDHRTCSPLPGICDFAT